MTPPPAPLPNFFLAGAPKAGTTSLHFYLGQHPQVFMSPIKEPMFFGAADLLSPDYRGGVQERVTRNRPALTAYLDSVARRPSRGLVLDWDDYVRLFRDVRDERAIGESSTGYLRFPSAAPAIRSRLPHARLIFVLRDPAERLFTLYRQSFWRDPRITFRAWFEAMLETPRHGAATVGAGRYGTQLQRYYDLFPPQQLRVHLYEDYRADARAVLRDLFAFLGVEPDHPIDLSHRHRETAVPRFPRLHALRRRLMGNASPTRWLPEAARRAVRRLYQRRPADRTMDPGEREMVIDHYRDEIRRTADLIRRDLSAWLR